MWIATGPSLPSPSAKFELYTMTRIYSNCIDISCWNASFLCYGGGGFAFSFLDMCRKLRSMAIFSCLNLPFPSRYLLFILISGHTTYEKTKYNERLLQFFRVIIINRVGVFPTSWRDQVLNPPSGSLQLSIHNICITLFSSCDCHLPVLTF